MLQSPVVPAIVGSVRSPPQTPRPDQEGRAGDTTATQPDVPVTVDTGHSDGPAAVRGRTEGDANVEGPSQEF